MIRVICVLRQSTLSHVDILGKVKRNLKHWNVSVSFQALGMGGAREWPMVATTP